MSDPVNENVLENRYYISLVLRLVLDQQGRLLQGELIDMTHKPPQRFTTLAGLNRAVAAWFKQQEQAKDETEI
ncbi:MAG TPA: hypothetical protein PKD98_21590 [Anaerolineae bacterium]|nr:hypothetical protein [Anaerolineae bacterium]